MICVRAVAARRLCDYLMVLMVAAWKLRHTALPGDTTASDVPAFNSNLSELAFTRASHDSRYRTVKVPGTPLLLGAVDTSHEL